MRRRMAWVLTLLMTLAVMTAGRATEFDAEAFFGPGFTMDGTVLVVPEGITQLGEFYEEEADEDDGDDWFGDDADADWYDGEWEDDDGEEVPDDADTQEPEWVSLEMSGMYDDEWVVMPVTNVRLPSTLRRMGAQAIYVLSAQGDLVIPEGVTEIRSDAFMGTSADRLILPSTLEKLDVSFMYFSEFGEIVISPDNPWYCTVDGVIFTKDMRTLVLYPEWKKETHYDVPAGVQVIGPRAFMDNRNLQTVSLPIGLREIGELAFCTCGRLTAVNVPLTVTKIGRSAFRECVSLQRVTLPPSLAHLLTVDPKDGTEDSTIFAECTALNDHFAGDNGGTGAGTFDPATYVVEHGRTHAYLANPVNANKKIPLYSADAPGKKVVGQAPSGAVLMVREGEITWQMLAENQSEAQWLTLDFVEDQVVRRDDVVRAPDALFEYSQVKGKGKLTVYASRDASSKKTRLSAAEAKEMNYYISFYGTTPWVQVMKNWNTVGWCFLGDVQLTREATGDGLTLGVVIAEKIGDRVNLREKPDKKSASLGKYFTGTQLKVIGEKGKFWQVEIVGQTGWMMKEFVRIVKEEGT